MVSSSSKRSDCEIKIKMSGKKLHLWRIAFPSQPTFVSSGHRFLKAHKRNTVASKTLNVVTHRAKKCSWKPLIMACGNSGIIWVCHTYTELSSPPALCLLRKITRSDYSSVFHFSSLTLWSGGEKWGECKRRKEFNAFIRGPERACSWIVKSQAL